MFGWIRRIDRHSQLFCRMAETVKADVASEESSRLGHTDGLRSLMIRCTDCKNADACETWLDAHEAGADSPPEFCLNGRALQRLRLASDTGANLP